MSEQGTFCWYEFMTRDADATIDFFKKVIGYGLTSVESPMGPYRMFTLPGSERPVAGIMQMDAPQFDPSIPPHVGGYIGCDDIEATVAKVKELGGNVHVDVTPAGEVGVFAVIQDPQEAWINLWQSREPMEAAPPGIGVFSWHELFTTNMEDAFEFYSTLFGWEKKQDMDMGEAGIYRLFGMPGTESPIGGMMTKTADMPFPPNWGFYITVEDIDKGVERVKSNGGTVLNGPMEVPGGDMVAQCSAPDQMYFALHASGS